MLDLFATMFSSSFILLQNGAQLAIISINVSVSNSIWCCSIMSYAHATACVISDFGKMYFPHAASSNRASTSSQQLSDGAIVFYCSKRFDKIA